MANEDIVSIDNVNVISINHLKISLQAIEDKIIVLMDGYKTGFECKECNGSGRVKSVVADVTKECPACNGKGALLVIPEISKSLPSTGVVVSMGPLTPYMAMRQIEKALKDPKMKQNVTEEEERIFLRSLHNEIPIRLGARVVFGPHVGTLMPFKGNVRLKVMRVGDPLCVMFGDEDTAAKDFMDYEAEPY